jgi:hypothetical protein
VTHVAGSATLQARKARASVSHSVKKYKLSFK